MNEINVKAFTLLCVDLILQGQEKHVKGIITAFNDIDNRFGSLHELLQMPAYSLDRMLLAFHIREMRDQPLDFRIWPHSVLLNAVIDIQNIEQFILLLNAVETTVKWEDTFTCVRQLVQNLPVNAVEDIVSQVDKLGELKGILLIYLFEIVIRNSETYSFNANDLLNQIKIEFEKIRNRQMVYIFSPAWTVSSWNAKEVFPRTFQMLFLFELLKVLPGEKFPEDYAFFQTIAFDLFYRETDTVSRWGEDKFSFLWAYKQTLSAINHELVDRWQTLMQEIETKWDE